MKKLLSIALMSVMALTASAQSSADYVGKNNPNGKTVTPTTIQSRPGKNTPNRFNPTQKSTTNQPALQTGTQPNTGNNSRIQPGVPPKNGKTVGQIKK